MINKEPSKYINQNLCADEKIVCIPMSSKGFFNKDPADVVITNKRIFARYDDGRAFSFSFLQIKNIEAVPNKGFFGGQKNKGAISVYGPYNRVITFPSDNLDTDMKYIRKILAVK